MRDARAESALAERGLMVEVIWEHELRQDPYRRAIALAELLRNRRSPRRYARTKSGELQDPDVGPLAGVIDDD